MQSAKSNRRKSIRFVPDPGTLAKIDPEPDRPDGAFVPSISGLVPNESSKGCSLILLKHEKIREGAEVKIQVGQLGPLKAQIRWLKEIEEGVLRVGVFYLD